MPGSGNLCGIANGVADIADLIFTVRIAIKRAVFGDIGIVQRVTGGLVSGERVQHGIAGRSLRQLVDDLLAFHQHLCGRIHEASENDMTLDLEIRECRGRARGDGGEHRRGFGSAALVVGTIEQLGLIKGNVMFTHDGGEGGVQAYAAGKGDGGAAFGGFAGPAHFDRVHEHRYLIALPCGHAHDQRQFAHTADTAFRLAIVNHAFHAAAGRTQHAVVTKQRIQRDMPTGEQLRDAGGVGMRQIQLRGQLRHVFKRGRRQSQTVLLTPAANAVQRSGGPLIAFAHVLTHFPTALRYSAYPGLRDRAASIS